MASISDGISCEFLLPNKTSPTSSATPLLVSLSTETDRTDLAGLGGGSIVRLRGTGGGGISLFLLESREVRGAFGVMVGGSEGRERSAVGVGNPPERRGAFGVDVGGE